MQSMRHSRKAAESLTRIAIVQFDYQPCAYLAYPHLEEPALLAEGELGITSLHLSVKGTEEKLHAFRREVANEYETFIGNRVRHILEELDRFLVNVVVFPQNTQSRLIAYEPFKNLQETAQ